MSLPVPTTAGVSGLLGTSCTLLGAVQTGGLDTTCYFSYGPTPALGFTTGAVVIPGASATAPLSAPVTGLVEFHTYYFEVVATNSSGTATSAQSAFVSQPPPSFTSGVLNSYQAWTSGSDDAANYMRACASMFEQVFSLVSDVGDPEVPDSYSPGWSALLDPYRCPPQFLPFLSQFDGTAVPPGMTASAAVQQIVSQPAHNRGTLSAIISAAKSQLGGTQKLWVRERTNAAGNPDAYHMVLTFFTTECPSVQNLVNAVNAAKPGGIQISFVSVAGYTWNLATHTWSADTITWDSTMTTQP